MSDAVMSEGRGVGSSRQRRRILVSLYLALVLAMVDSILFPAQAYLYLPKPWAKGLYGVQILILPASPSLYLLGVAPMVLGMRDLVYTLTNYNEFLRVTALAMLYSTYFLADTLYTSLGELSVEILMRFYPTFFTGVLTSSSLMFAVAYWVINRAEEIQDPRIADLLRVIRSFVFTTYIFDIFVIVLFPFSIAQSSPPTSSLIPTSFNLFFTLLLFLSYPFAYIIGVIQALVIFDAMIDALRSRRLPRRRRRPWSL
jgi:hypothetical protein